MLASYSGFNQQLNSVAQVKHCFFQAARPLIAVHSFGGTQQEIESIVQQDEPELF